VESIYKVEQIKNSLQLVESPVETPFLRDYNAIGHDTPSAWAKELDLSNWGIFVAMDGEQPIGGATVALDGLVFPVRHMQRKDLAVLWDIRVHPDHQSRGVGTALFHHAADWARVQGCGQLGIETDSSNIPACKFYARMGCELGGILKYGYSGVPKISEYAMLLWYLDL
jgi:GNAT superfamily N-acetyltransferase